MSSFELSRRGFSIGLAALTGAAVAGCGRAAENAAVPNDGARTAARPGAVSMTVYRDPSCGCCEAWAALAQDAGYEVSVIDYPERWCEPCDDDMKARIRAGTRARLHEHWRVFADQFAIGFDAASPGALELLATVVSKWSGSRPMLQAERPSFYAQLMRVEQHPEVAAVFQRHWP